VQEEDVLDTWASSWLWPLGTLGWPDAEAQRSRGFDYFYPTEALVTDPGIIFFWVARMIMAGLEFARPGESLERRIPFRHVYFTGVVRDQQGRRMSKSLGNSPDPLDLIAKYGADALRFGIISIAPQGQDIRFAEERIEQGKNFCNKLWNACRFRQKSGPMADNSSLRSIAARLDASKFDADDHAVLYCLITTMAGVERSFKMFEFSAAAQSLYGFFWNDFCDWYVEVSKSKLESEETKSNCLAVQDLVLRHTLLLLEPFIPFITEELWELLGFGSPQTLLMRDGRIESSEEFAVELSAATRDGWSFGKARFHVQSVADMKAFVSQARALKAEHNLASRRDVRFFVIAADPTWTAIQANLSKLARLAGAAEIVRKESVDGAPAVVTPLGTLYLDLASAVDPAAEKKRLGKELEALGKHIAGTEARLANQAFVSKAPPAVLDGARKQLAELQAKRAEVERLLKAI
jgi:valyl-tRNA synthetase